MTKKRLKVRKRMVRNVNQSNAEKALMCSPQNLMPVNVFVSMTPGIDRILSTTTWPRTLKSSASIFAIRSYSPNKGWSSTISLTFRSSLYTSCSLAGAVLMSTNPMAIPRDSNSAVARNDEASSRSARGHNDLCGLEQPFGGRDACEPSGSDDLRLVPKEVGRPIEQLAEQPRRIHVVDFLRGIECDGLSQRRRESCDAHIVFRSPRPDVNQVDVLHTVPQERQASRVFHRSLVHDGHLIALRVREHPGRGRVRLANGAEVRRIDAVPLQRLSIVIWEVGPNERGKRVFDAKTRRRPREISSGPPEVPLPVKNLDRGVWRREAAESHDVVHRDMPEGADKIPHAHASNPRDTSENRSNGVKSISSSRHSSASSDFAKTRSASMAGQISECPFPMYAVRYPWARSSKRRSNLHVPHNVHVPSAHGYSIRT